MRYQGSPQIEAGFVEQLIQESEDRFTDSIQKAVHYICQVADAKALTVSGPTCSGKTTAVTRIRQLYTQTNTAPETGSMQPMKHSLILLSLDDFFKNRIRDNQISGTPPDYDTVAALDLDSLRETWENLRTGSCARIPIYDFVSGKRTGYRIHTPKPGELYLWEGIQAVFPEVLEVFGKKQVDIALNVTPPAQGNLTGVDLRLCRRILRDNNSRGASPDFTLFLWESVRENEQKNLLPSLPQAPVQINTWMAYEPYILAKALPPLLACVSPESPMQTEVSRLTSLLAPYQNSPITPAWIPQDSVYREFIGEA